MILRAADLFCGAGGTSTGIMRACAQLGRTPDLLAVNHWPTAINTHSLNHPGVRHLCESLDIVNPQRAVGGKHHLHLLAASPECTHHSIAAGGRPRNDQSRATAWHVCRWAADLTIDHIFLENVKEFAQWGPLTKAGKPMKRRKGETFKAFVNALRSMGYTVEHRIQNAADFGDPTSRQRLILMASRRGPVRWPEASHGAGRQPYRTAREIIDWDLKGKSIFGRKKALSPNTLRRIAAGLRKFGGANAEPFLVMLYGTNDARNLDRPAPTVTAHGQHIGLAEPFIITMEHQGSVRSADKPLPTITTARGGAMAVVEPFIIHSTHHGDRKIHSPEEPLPTVTGANRGEMALVEPMLMTLDRQLTNRSKARSINEPVATITGTPRVALIEPMLIGQQSCAAARPVSEPCPTIATAGAVALVEPFIVKYYGTGAAVGVDEPLDTVTTRDRFLLIQPSTGKVVAELDIRFRMLQPHELAGAMSFPKDYQFQGTKCEQVKQIGNAVPVELARAHIQSLVA